MKNKEEPIQSKGLLSLKTTIRTKDFDSSKNFYTQILKLNIVEEYYGENRGCIVCFDQIGGNSFLEISEIREGHPYYHKTFDQSIANDKLDIQIKTDSLAYWTEFLAGKCEFRGPIDRPWGARYLYLRDPDGLQIIIYEEI